MFLVVAQNHKNILVSRYGSGSALWDLNTIVKAFLTCMLKLMCSNVSTEWLWLVNFWIGVYSLDFLLLHPKGKQITLLVSLLHSALYITMSEFPISLSFLFFTKVNVCLSLFYVMIPMTHLSFPFFSIRPERAGHFWTSRSAWNAVSGAWSMSPELQYILKLWWIHSHTLGLCIAVTHFWAWKCGLLLESLLCLLVWLTWWLIVNILAGQGANYRGLKE